MSNALQLRQVDAMKLSELQTLGQILAKSGFFAETKDAAQAVVKVLAGMELGFPAIASMAGVNIIKGRVTLSANLMAAAIKSSGKYTYRVRKLDDAGCSVEFFENGESIGFSAFTRDDAQKGGLLGGDNWKKYFRNMAFARAISNGFKWYCPDVCKGPVYTPEELGAEVDGETGEVIEIPPEVGEPVPLVVCASCNTSLSDSGDCPNCDVAIAEPEPEPLRPVKLEGAQPQADWCGDLPEGLEGAPAHVIELAKKLKWHEGKVTQCIEAKFGVSVMPGKLRDYLEMATTGELRELYRAIDKQHKGGKR